MKKIVFDIGMHKGEDTAFYIKRGFRVVGVEANPALVTILRSRFSEEIASNNLVLIPKAIFAHTGHTDFYVNSSYSVWGSLDPVFVKRNTAAGTISTPIRVETLTMAELVSGFEEPYYIKVDIEGADLDCLRSLASTVCRPKFLSIESSVTSPVSLWKEELDLLTGMGYTRFKFVDQSKLSDLNGQVLSREGKQIIYEHEPDASGPFGDEAPGKWMDVEETVLHAVKLRRRFLAFSRLSNTPSIVVKVTRSVASLLKIDRHIGWCDLHAAKA